MADYTMTLEEVLDFWTTNEHYDRESRIEAGRKKLFDFPYPFFDESKKKEFETRFIRNFYFREIGFETEGRFKFELENWLNLRMPYYNQLFKSELLQFDPLVNVDVKTDHTKKNQKDQRDNRTVDFLGDQKNDSHSTSETDGKSHSTNATKGKENTKDNRNTKGDTKQDNFKRDVQADTPDERLALTTNDGSGILEYASQIGEEKGKNNQTTSSDESATGERTTNSDATTDMTASSDAKSDSTSNTNTKNNTKDQFNSDVDQNEDFNQNQKGKTGGMTYSQMVNEYRGTFLQIEREIFKEMNPLFMLVY